MKHYIGVDVGTSSVRAGLFDERGRLVSSRVEPIKVFNPRVDFYEQSADDIWSAVCKCVKYLRQEDANVDKSVDITSIGFDATCSLVALDATFRPVSVSPETTTTTATISRETCTSDEDVNVPNVIMWMDHRAKHEADYINSLGLECLRTVGGKISPEMDPPKILWLKRHFAESYALTAHFFSLPDYLVWRATRVPVRSVCTTACKWLLKSSRKDKCWDKEFWSRIGLEELAANDFARIGSRVEKPLEPCHDLKICGEFAAATGLDESSVRVGVSMIDAHAGGIGAIALTLGFLGPARSLEFDELLVLVSGTSSCFMATSKEAHFVSGIWGPYYDVMVPGMWLNEAGQSVAGKLIDHLIESHPASSNLKKISAATDATIYETLEQRLEKLVEEKSLANMAYLTKHFHVYPDFHGNRSPLADANMSGLICGLSFDSSIDGLAVLYLSTMQALAYQSLHILDKLAENDVRPKMITIIGGLAQNRLYCQILCDVCAIPVLIPHAPETSVILGSAILGASNAHEFKDMSFRPLIERFGSSSSSSSSSILLSPNVSTAKFHRQKYQVFKSMIDDQIKYRNLMDE